MGVTEELRKILEENNLAEYIEIFEREKLYIIEDLESLGQDDYKELGITALGDRKRFISLFSIGMDLDIRRPAVVEEVEQLDFPTYGFEDNKTKATTPNIVINNAGENSSTAHTGLAGVLGGIIGAATVIVIILVILSNESWTFTL